MTEETASGQAGLTRGPAGPAAGKGQPRNLSDRTARYGTWIAVVVRCLGDRRFQASVITGVIGLYALASLLKNNQAQPMRRAVRWYGREGNRPASR